MSAGEDLRHLLQTPLPGPFSSLDIEWEQVLRVAGRNNLLADRAIIPWDRVEDFRIGGVTSLKAPTCL